MRRLVHIPAIARFVPALALGFASIALAQSAPVVVHPIPKAATPPAAAPPITAPLCPAQPLVSHLFSASQALGEKLRFHLDIYGADVGTLEVWSEPPAREDRGTVALVAHARAHTSAFVNTNSGGYATFTTSKVGPGLSAFSAHEEVDDSGTHWVHEMEFPPKLGKLAVRASKDGEALPITLSASPSARDLLSTFFAIRAVPLTGTSPICFEVYAGRHMWKMTGTIGPRESLDTPLGKINTVRIDLASVRLDDARVTRSARFWISDDSRRLPIAAIAEVRGKVLRAQLEAASARGWSLGRQAK